MNGQEKSLGKSHLEELKKFWRKIKKENDLIDLAVNNSNFQWTFKAQDNVLKLSWKTRVPAKSFAINASVFNGVIQFKSGLQELATMERARVEIKDKYISLWIGIYI